MSTKAIAIFPAHLDRRLVNLSGIEVSLDAPWLGGWMPWQQGCADCRPRHATPPHLPRVQIPCKVMVNRLGVHFVFKASDTHTATAEWMVEGLRNGAEEKMIILYGSWLVHLRHLS